MTPALDITRSGSVPPYVYVSAHALRRYFERVRGLVVLATDDGEALWALRVAGADIDGARAEIERIVAPAVGVFAASVKLGNVRFVIQGRAVVTVVPTARCAP